MSWEDNNIVIYGAGKYAVALYKYLWMKKKQNNVKCFVVTKHDQNSNVLLDLPIMEYEDFYAHYHKEFIVIAIKDYIDVQSKLERDNISEYRVAETSEIKKYQTMWMEYLQHLPIRNKIFFDCFHGRGFECNCKYIAQKLIEEKCDVDLVWNVTEKDMYDFPYKIRQVKSTSIEYETELYSSRIIVDNVGTAPHNKRKEQYFINTWHGTGPFKKVALSIESLRKSAEYVEKRKNEYNKTDLYISNSADNTYMFRESFQYEGEILQSGNPRNDILFNSQGIKEKVYDELKLDIAKKVLLYAPTFRDSIESSFEKYTLDMNKILKTCEKRFGGEFVLLFRFHNKLRDYVNFSNFYSNGINVTNYPDVMELVVAADVLITDYSSIMWDFSLQRRPVFLYHNDEQEYINDRDFYWPISRWPYVVAHTSEEMCEKIISFDEKDYLFRLERFFQEDPSYDDGHASERVVERIMDVIDHPEKYGKA